MDMLKSKEKIQNIFDIIVVVILGFICISKGGFYKTDSSFFELSIIILFFIYIAINIVLKVKNNKKIDIVSLMLFILTLTYSLPIIFKNYANFDSSLDEFIRYLCVYVIYNIVKRGTTRIYEKAIIVIGVVVCFLGFDGIATRLFESFLLYFKSGYLDIDRLRMSSTIQYANTFALLILISYVFLCKIMSGKLNLLLARKSLLEFNTYLTLSTIFISAIILSESKMVMILLLFAFVSNYILCKRKLNLIITLLSLIEGVIYSNFVLMLVVNMPSFVMISIFLLYALNYILLVILTKFIKNILSSNIHLNVLGKRRKKLLIASLVFLFICVLLVVNKSIKFNMKYTEHVDSVDKYIYGVKGGNNLIDIKINADVKDKYLIEIWQKKSDGTQEMLKEVSYSNTSTGKFVLNVNLDSDVKAIHFRFKVLEGDFTLEYIKINNEVKNINYTLIPYSLIEKVYDLLNGSNSVSDRMEYYKDAIKIITSNKLNFIIGVGGGGFEQLYKSVRTSDYSSTEVHSSVLQIFLESGVFGFIAIIIILVITLIRSKGYGFVAFVIICIHIGIDLDFSYFSMLVLFAIMLGILSKDKTVNN